MVVVGGAEAEEAVVAGVEVAVSTVADTAVGEEDTEEEEEGATGGEPRISIPVIPLILYNWSRFGPVL